MGWLIGLILLWSSRLWTTRDKLIGTLIVPGGIATAAVGAGAHGRRRDLAEVQRVRNPSQSGDRGRDQTRSLHCVTVSGPSLMPTVWQIALIAFFVLGPIVSAVYLARRAGR